MLAEQCRTTQGRWETETADRGPIMLTVSQNFILVSGTNDDGDGAWPRVANDRPGAGRPETVEATDEADGHVGHDLLRR